MSLSGNLGFVSLDEVLRLISRSHQEGSVNVTGNGFKGRVFVTSRGIGLATTFEDSELTRHLANSGLINREMIAALESGHQNMSDLVEGIKEKVVELLREMTVEGLYQIGRNGEDFEVVEGGTTPFASPAPFELEAILDDASRRASEWQAVSRLVPDLSTRIEFERDLGERESITIPAEAWKIVTEIGGGASVNEIADRLGRTTFWTARMAGHFINDELMHIDSDVRPAPEKPDEYADPWEDSLRAPLGPEETAVAEETGNGADPDTSWWEEATADTRDQASDEPAEESMFGRFASRVRSDDADPTEDATMAEADHEEAEQRQSTTPTLTVQSAESVEDDTEAFLERVFSELGSDGEPEDDEGYGLLRRRRLGTTRDLPADS